MPHSPLDLTPLSAGQRMIWWFEQQSPHSTAMHVVSVQTLGEGIGRAALQAALTDIVTTHPILRGHMHRRDGAWMPEWLTEPADTFELPCLELPPMPTAQGVAQLTARAWAPFDLLRGPLIRAATALDEQHPNRLIFMLSMHHSVADGETILLILRGLADRLAGRPLLGAQPYRSWVASEAKRWQPNGRERQQAVAHWRQRLTGLPERPGWPWPAPLPSKKPRPRTLSLAWSLEDALWQRLRGLARQVDASDFCLVAALAAWMLYRIHGQPDVVLAYPVSQRRHRTWARTFGHMVNLAVLRLHLAPHLSFFDILTQAQRHLREDLPFTELPMETLIEELRPAREPGRMPWAGLLLAPNRRQREAGALPHSTAWPLPPLDSQDHLQLVWSGDATHCAGSLNYATAHVPTAIAQGLLEYWQEMARRLPETASQPLGDWFAAHRLTSQEQLRLRQWNATQQALPAPDTSLAQAFAMQAARTPEATALRDLTGHTWSYADLAHQATALSAHVTQAMQRLQQPPGAPIGLLLERSGQAIIAILAILQAGGAYLPLHPADPPDRLQQLIQLSGIKLVLSMRAHWVSLALDHLALDVVCLDALPPATQPPSWVIPPARPDQAAYILFTSGSTGTPKAVAVGHRQVLRLVHGLAPVQLSAQDILLHAAPLAFDASTFEIWGALLHGATLVIYPAGPLDIAELAQCIEREHISTLWLTAALFEQFARKHSHSLANVQQLIAGGDVLPPSSVQRLHAAHPRLRMFNGYGPTETTTFATLHRITSADTAGTHPIPIGTPLGNTRIHLLDAAGRPVPVGQIGEICIAGDGVALGYVGDEAQTACRFVPEPGQPAGGRMYRSGDWGAWRPEGGLQFLGREDSQVKIRGHRVELGEVEATLQHLDGVKTAAVLIERTTQGPRLLACVRARHRRVLHINRLASEAAQRLPSHMLPGRWVLVSKWPMDANGKLNRDALRRLAEASPTPAAPPTWDHTEAAALCAQLQKLWAHALELPSCDRQDHFLELGGSSLSAARLCAAIEAECHRSVSMAELYRYPTPGELTSWLLTQATTTSDRLQNPVLCLKPGQPSHLPIVFIHGIGGKIHVPYLANQLPATWPLYSLRGIQPLNEASLEREFPTLEKIASFYAASIQADLGNRFSKIILAGYSAGGVLLPLLRDALTQLGMHISGLMILDAPPPGNIPLHDLLSWMQPRHASESSPTSVARHTLSFRRVFARCLMSPPPARFDPTPTLLVMAGHNALEKINLWRRTIHPAAIHELTLTHRQHANFLLPPSDAIVARAIEKWVATLS